MLSWLWNHKVDLKNWHLMAYNWNKFPEIGPLRETWVHAWGPLPSSPHTILREGNAYCDHHQDSDTPPTPRPQLGQRPCHSPFLKLGPTFSGSECGEASNWNFSPLAFKRPGPENSCKINGVSVGSLGMLVTWPLPGPQWLCGIIAVSSPSFVCKYDLKKCGRQRSIVARD
jgi:hypothetical protein